MAAAAQIIGAAVSIGGAFATGGTLAAVFAALNVGLGFLSSALSQQPKARVPAFAGFDTRASDARTLLRQPITARRHVIGEQVVSGPLVFHEATDDNRFHHLVIVLADHESDGIGTVYFGNDPIFDDDLDGSGDVTSGKYKGKVTIKKHLGGAGQVADSDLVSAAGKWTNDHIGAGQTYLYVKTETDRDLFPNVIPQNIRARVRGRKLLDTRTAATAWTPNPALALNWYLTDTRIGLGSDGAAVDDGYTDASANTCDEIVDTLEVAMTVTAVVTADDALELSGERLPVQTGDRVEGSSSGTLPDGLSAATDYYVIVVREVSTAAPVADPKALKIQLAASYDDALAGTAVVITDAGSGTHTITKTGEPRYTANGVIETDRPTGKIVDDLKSAFGARLVPPGAAWRMIAAAWDAPTVIFDEGDLRGPIVRRGRHPRRERFNAVKGIYVSPLNADQPQDYPAVTSAAYEAEDGGQRTFLDLDLAFTSRAGMAKRLAKIALERHRRQRTLPLTLSMEGLLIQAGDTVGIDNARRGWVNEAHDVEEWALQAAEGEKDAPVMLVPVTLRQTDAQVYAWDETMEEVIVDPAPSQSPLDPFRVANPTGFAVTTETVADDTGVIANAVILSWSLAADQYVVAGGQYEVQWKRTSEVEWQPSFFLDGGRDRVIVPAALPFGINHDFQIRSVNSLGIRPRDANGDPAWQSIFGYAIGASGAGATARLDYGDWLNPAAVFRDRGDWTEAASETIDYGDWT